MRAIKEGDLYFLNPAVHIVPSDDAGALQEKRLSYILGTVSSRPAVVIRAPNFWDRYNTVTVIPAISKGSPAVVLHLHDRYDMLTESDYPFIPHNPHTIPISRLGRYIGSLEDKELKQILYAFEWIHDPNMRANPGKYPVPEIYKSYVGKNAPVRLSWKENKDSRAGADITIDRRNGYRITSKMAPELNGFSFGKSLKSGSGFVSESAEKELKDEVGFVAVEAPLPDSNDTKEKVQKVVEEKIGPSTKEEKLRRLEETMAAIGIVPVEKDFPPSMFDKDILNRIAGKFTIPSTCYDSASKRRADILTSKEVAKILGSNDVAAMNPILEVYDKMTAMDARLLGVRLPITALSEACSITKDQAAMLKRLCNILNSMDDAEYEERISSPEHQTYSEEEVKENQPPPKMTKEELRAVYAELRPYMNEKMVLRMPRDLSEKFLQLSMGQIRHIWSGQNFKKTYQNAKQIIKEAIAVEALLPKRATKSSDEG